MNLAFADALNLAWKIHAVESGLASRQLLDTYETERRPVAESVIDFDHVFAKMFAGQEEIEGWWRNDDFCVGVELSRGQVVDDLFYGSYRAIP